MAIFPASAGSYSSFARAVGLFKATGFSFTILLPYTLFNSVPVIMRVAFCSASSYICMPSAMRGCVMACTSLKNEEEGAEPPKNSLLRISSIRSLSTGILLLPLTRRAWLVRSLKSYLVCTLCLRNVICSEANEILMSHL